MRGHVNPQAMLFSYVSPDSRVPATHPLRRIKAMAEQVLRELSPTFAEMYSTVVKGAVVSGALEAWAAVLNGYQQTEPLAGKEFPPPHLYPLEALLRCLIKHHTSPDQLSKMVDRWIAQFPEEARKRGLGTTILDGIIVGMAETCLNSK